MRALALAALLLCAGPLRADVDASDYAAGRTIRSDERGRVASEIAEEARREQERAALEAAQEARRRAELVAAEARKPAGERLLQARCTLCHPASHYLASGHTLLGWHLVVLRMRHLNHAPLTWEDQQVIAGHLADVRPGSAWAEYGAAAGAASLPLLALAGARRWRRGRQAMRLRPAAGARATREPVRE